MKTLAQILVEMNLGRQQTAIHKFIREKFGTLPQIKVGKGFGLLVTGEQEKIIREQYRAYREAFLINWRANRSAILKANRYQAPKGPRTVRPLLPKDCDEASLAEVCHKVEDLTTRVAAIGLLLSKIADELGIKD